MSWRIIRVLYYLYFYFHYLLEPVPSREDNQITLWRLQNSR